MLELRSPYIKLILLKTLYCYKVLGLELECFDTCLRRLSNYMHHYPLNFISYIVSNKVEKVIMLVDWLDCLRHRSPRPIVKSARN